MLPYTSLEGPRAPLTIRLITTHGQNSPPPYSHTPSLTLELLRALNRSLDLIWREHKPPEANTYSLKQGSDAAKDTHFLVIK